MGKTYTVMQVFRKLASVVEFPELFQSCLTLRCSIQLHCEIWAISLVKEALLPFFQLFFS